MGVPQKLDGQVTTCLWNGTTYSAGDTFKMDCNTCSCSSNGQVVCALMACLGDTGVFLPTPDAAPDQAPQLKDAMSTADVVTGDARQSCVWQDMSLAIGQSIDAGDGCNICVCTVAGLACTARACVSPDASTLDCSLSSQLSFGYTGDLAAYSDGYAISSGSQKIWVIRNYCAGKGDGSIPSCSPSLPTCGAAGVVSLSTIAQDLTDADVQFAFGLSTPHVYGVDNRPSDGAVWVINQASGGSIFVGTPCPSPVMNSCQPIPPGIQRLADDLKTLATAASAAPECAGL
jgi:hypothetical protein